MALRLSGSFALFELSELFASSGSFALFELFQLDNSVSSQESWLQMSPSLAKNM